MKTNIIREMTTEDLKKKLNELKISINNLTLKVKRGDAKSIKDKRAEKQDIARIATVIKEREILEEIDKEESDV